MQNEYPDLILYILGEGQQMKKLEEEAVQLKISKSVIFTGFVSGKVKYDYIQFSDILIIPSIVTKGGHAEGLPVVLMEGLASGKLVIATFESGADDIIKDGENGFLINQKDPWAIANAVKRIMQMDETAKNDMITKAKESAKAFDWNIIVKRHYDFVFKQLKT